MEDEQYQGPERRRGDRGAKREQGLTIALSVAAVVVAFLTWVGPAVHHFMSYPIRTDARLVDLESHTAAADSRIGIGFQRIEDLERRTDVLDSRLDELCRRMGNVEAKKP